MCIFNIGVATSGLFNNAAAGKSALACLLCWVFCYGASAGPIGFVAAAETSTPRLRAQTTSFNLGCYGLGLWVPATVPKLPTDSQRRLPVVHLVHDQPRRREHGHQGDLHLGWLARPDYSHPLFLLP